MFFFSSRKCGKNYCIINGVFDVWYTECVRFKCFPFCSAIKCTATIGTKLNDRYLTTIKISNVLWWSICFGEIIFQFGISLPLFPMYVLPYLYTGVVCWAHSIVSNRGGNSSPWIRKTHHSYLLEVHCFFVFFFGLTGDPFELETNISLDSVRLRGDLNA